MEKERENVEERNKLIKQQANKLIRSKNRAKKRKMEKFASKFSEPLKTRKKKKNGEPVEGGKDWNLSTHTQYIRDRNDQPHIFGPLEIEKKMKLSKNEREKLYKENFVIQYFLLFF